MRSLSLALFALCVLSVAATAQTNAGPATTQSPAAEEPASKTDDQKVLCVDQDPDASTWLPPRHVCHTRQEWNKLGGIPR